MALQESYKPASPSASPRILDDIIQLDQSNFLSDFKLIYNISLFFCYLYTTYELFLQFLDTIIILYILSLYQYSIYYLKSSLHPASALIQSTGVHFSSLIYLADIIFNKRNESTRMGP